MRPDDEMKAQMKGQMGAEVGKHVGKRVGKIAGMVIGGIFLVVILGFLFGWVLQLLWNATVASMFDWPEITYWEAVGLFLLAKLLFGFGFGGGGRHKHGRHHHRRGAHARKFWKRGDVFKDYWREEGKVAYEAYVAKHGKGEAPKE
jgi:hypothetical protein